MPELPEVTIIANNLRKALLKKSVARIKLKPNQLFFSPPSEIKNALLNQQLLKIQRRGKFLLFYFSSAKILLVHLGMSGQLLLYKVPEDPHLCMELQFSGGELLSFRDPRRFGKIGIITGLTAYPTLAKMGPEPFSPKTRPELLYSLFHSSSSPIKNLLMEQAKLAGLGNIYASEALYEAGIHPLSPGRSLSLKDYRRLLPAIRKVLRKAIKEGGTTFDGTYLNARGNPGGFLAYCGVYERAGEKCCKCKSLIKKITLANRSTYFCPGCQKPV